MSGVPTMMLRFALFCQLLLACGGSGAAQAPPAECPDGSVASTGSDQGCPSVLPSKSGCPGTSPPYEEAASIIARRCTVCHSPTGVERVHQFDTYSLAHEQKNAMLVQVFACAMPPPTCDGSMNLDEREKLLTWLQCGALPDLAGPDGG